MQLFFARLPSLLGWRDDGPEKPELRRHGQSEAFRGETFCFVFGGNETESFANASFAFRSPAHKRLYLLGREICDFAVFHDINAL
jgi:hypothetical protein